MIVLTPLFPQISPKRMPAQKNISYKELKQSVNYNLRLAIMESLNEFNPEYAYFGN